MLKNITILITGGTGSFGKAFVRCILKPGPPRRLVVFASDEQKQWETWDAIREAGLDPER